MGTSQTITVDVASKKVTYSTDLAIRELIAVTITNLGGATPANLLLTILNRAGTSMATLAVWTGTTTALGTLDTDTTALETEFTGLAARAQKTFRIGVFDTVAEQLLVNDNIVLMNNPFTGA